MTRIADPTFGVDRYAWAILALLSTYEPDFADFDEKAQMYDVRIETDVHVDGDRRWIALTLFKSRTAKSARQVIAFGRSPLGDDIVVECWVPAESPEQDLEHRVHRFTDLMVAATFIRQELGRSYVS